ncbi:MAG TPA: DNA primase [Candidatus Binatia bacterium]|jgi:DNA primase
MIPEEKIIEIRDRASIVEVISDYLTLKKTGRNHLGLCPFHSEKTPSFTVNEEKGIFHCFGCGAGGSVFHFLMQYDHLSFPEAVERVGKRYGIVVERLQAPGARRDAEQRESLYRLNERAAAYFHGLLFGQGEGRRALQYLKSRGVDEPTARRFDLGYAPETGQGLAAFLKKEGLSLKDAIRLGLLSDRGGERYGEKFFGRVMFPIADAAGKIVGFGGRVLGQGMPKYLNSAETPLFRKGSTVYGLYQARERIRETDRVLVVEGYLDVVALAQFGVADAVATLGTALTPDHVRMLGRYTKKIIVLFDGDEAGRKAAARSLEIFIEGGLLGLGAFLPKGEDPDTFVRSKGKEALEKQILDLASPLADFYFTWLRERYGSSLEGKSQIAQEMSRVLAKVRNPLEADLLAATAADRLGIRENLLREALRQAGEGKRPAAAPPSAGALPEAGKEKTERLLIALMLRFPAMIERVEKESELQSLLSPAWNEILQEMLTEWRKRNSVDAAGLAERFSSERASKIAGLVLEAETIAEDESEKMMGDLIADLYKRHLTGLKRDLRQAIRIAEEKKDEKTKRERMLEWQEVDRRERQLIRQ